MLLSWSRERKTTHNNTLITSTRNESDEKSQNKRNREERRKRWYIRDVHTSPNTSPSERSTSHAQSKPRRQGQVGAYTQDVDPCVSSPRSRHFLVHKKRMHNNWQELILTSDTNMLDLAMWYAHVQCLSEYETRNKSAENNPHTTITSNRQMAPLLNSTTPQNVQV